jgi:hypothetical protein
VKRDCRGQSICKNGASCLQDSVNCPETSMCICPSCFYGARCQFSSNGFGLSLDAILGSYIQSHANIQYQPVIVQISVTLSVLMTVMGLINGIFSIITFMNKEPRKTGCGLYLVGSSITTLFITVLFCIKFWILLAAQMKYMTNRSFLHFQCKSIDFILRIGLNMDQWLNACVAVERAMIVIKGVGFDKTKSKKIAKFIIPTLFLLTSGTNIHEIINRNIIDDESNDEKRIWCIVTYSTNVQKYNLGVNIFHFCTPFVINLLSTIIIIIKTARLRTNLKNQENYRKIFLEQLRQHKHLLITSFLLIILAIPRLIISFVSGCMESADDAWLFLIGYFISFIPPISTFFIFIVPSKVYTEEFYNTIRRYQRTLQIHFRLFC